MDDSDALTAIHRLPTPTRPLLGLTILVVEDSRFASEAMRLLCLRSGARIRRADCLKSARRHLQVYRPSVIVIDLGLPDGSGIDLIKELAHASPRVGIILATSGDDFAENAALAAGADGFLAKPVTSLAVFQSEILSRLPMDRQPPGPRLVQDEQVYPDHMALQDDLAHVADVLQAPVSDQTLDYVAQFLGGIARSADDGPLAKAATDLADARRSGGAVRNGAARIAGLIDERLMHKKAI